MYAIPRPAVKREAPAALALARGEAGARRCLVLDGVDHAPGGDGVMSAAQSTAC